MKFALSLIFISLLIISCNGSPRKIFEVRDSREAELFEDATWQVIESHVSSWRMRSLRFLVRFFDTFETQTETSLTCSLCKTIIAIGKALVFLLDWPTMHSIAVGVCQLILPRLYTNVPNLNSAAMCPGYIDNYGEHVYELLNPRNNRRPATYCLNFNACFPPKDRVDFQLPQIPQTGSVLERTSGPTLEERKANAIRFVQMTDVHLEKDYAQGTSTDCGFPVCCVPKYGEGDASQYGEYRCNLPMTTLELFFDKVVELNPDFVLYSGDTSPHTEWEETFEEQMDCSRVFLDTVLTRLGGYNVYPAMGNHDMFPINLFSAQHLPFTQAVLETYAIAWPVIANLGSDELEMILYGGYYTTVIQPGLRLISFNTNNWYTNNFYSSVNDVEIESMHQWLAYALQLAQNNGEKVILMGHHAPSESDTVVGRSRFLEELVTTYSDVILFQIGGHTHMDHYTVLSDAQGTPLALTLNSPPMSTYSDKNPSLRLFYLDPVTFELIDYEQYGFDLLQASQSTSPPSIDLIYSAIDEYGLADMTPASWQQLTNRMMTDDALLSKYHQNGNTRFNVNAGCDLECKAELLCSCSFYSYDNVMYCMEQFAASVVV